MPAMALNKWMGLSLWVDECHPFLPNSLHVFIVECPSDIIDQILDGQPASVGQLFQYQGIQTIFKLTCSPTIRPNTRKSAGLIRKNGAAEKTGHHCVRLYFSQILAPANQFCNPECITKSIPIGPVGLAPTSCTTSSRQPCWGMPRSDSGSLPEYLRGFPGTGLPQHILNHGGGHAWATPPRGHRLCKPGGLRGWGLGVWVRGGPFLA